MFRIFAKPLDVSGMSIRLLIKWKFNYKWWHKVIPSTGWISHHTFSTSRIAEHSGRNLSWTAEATVQNRSCGVWSTCTPCMINISCNYYRCANPFCEWKIGQFAWNIYLIKRITKLACWIKQKNIFPFLPPLLHSFHCTLQEHIKKCTLQRGCLKTNILCAIRFALFCLWFLPPQHLAATAAAAEHRKTSKTATDE